MYWDGCFGAEQNNTRGLSRGQKWHARPGPRAQVAASHNKTTRATWRAAKAAALVAGIRFSDSRLHFQVLIKFLVELKMEACVPMETKMGSKLSLWRLSAFVGLMMKNFSSLMWKTTRLDLGVFNGKTNLILGGWRWSWAIKGSVLQGFRIIFYYSFIISDYFK